MALRQEERDCRAATAETKTTHREHTEQARAEKLGMRDWQCCYGNKSCYSNDWILNCWTLENWNLKCRNRDACICMCTRFAWTLVCVWMPICISYDLSAHTDFLFLCQQSVQKCWLLERQHLYLPQLLFLLKSELRLPETYMHRPVWSSNKMWNKTISSNYAESKNTNFN